MLRVEPESAVYAANFYCIIISCEEDLPMCAKYRSRNIDVYSVELILSGVLTQDLELSRFRLKIPEQNLASTSSSVTQQPQNEVTEQSEARSVGAVPESSGVSAENKILTSSENTLSLDVLSAESETSYPNISISIS